jgi:putative membrane protein
MIYFIVTAIGIAIATLGLLFFSKYFIKFINSVNLKILNVIIILYLIAAVLMVDGFIGLFVSIVATAIGTLPIFLGVRRTHTMGFLLIPTLIYLWAL